jgi:hypothetical protein
MYLYTVGVCVIFNSTAMEQGRKLFCYFRNHFPSSYMENDCNVKQRSNINDIKVEASVLCAELCLSTRDSKTETFVRRALIVSL